MQDNTILNLAYDISEMTRDKVGAIEDIMQTTRILALNARIEAARAGVAGAAFGVVAEEIGKVSEEINHIASDFRDAVEGHTQRIEEAGGRMLTEFRGQRLTDLSLNAIEIIDRNLFERSCDVRWWATDSAVVAAVDGDDPAVRDALQRRSGELEEAVSEVLAVAGADPGRTRGAARLLAAAIGHRHAVARHGDEERDGMEDELAFVAAALA